MGNILQRTLATHTGSDLQSESLKRLSYTDHRVAEPWVCVEDREPARA